MRNLPAHLACWALSTLLVAPAARSAGLAEPDPYAAKPAPPHPLPPSFGDAKGFGTALDPYKDQLSGEERATFQRFSEELLSGAGGGLLKRAQTAIKNHRVKLRNEYGEYAAEEPVELFSYTIPNDPMLMLGTAKSYVGPVTTPPRLRKGAFQKRTPKPTPGGVAPAPVIDDDDWIFAEPAKLCTRGLSYGLETRSLYADLEQFPLTDGADVQTNLILTQIERMPNPIVLAERR